MSRPHWVVKDLADILGFDEGTITEAILPEFESQTHQVRLQSHLQDFLGPTPRAKAFIQKYIALRFPSLPSSSSVPSSSSSLQKGKPTASPSRNKNPSGSSTPSSRAGGGPGSSTSGLNVQAVNEAFGPGGKIYLKNREADDRAYGGLPASGLSSGIGSGSAGGNGFASGQHTPQFRQPGQRAGGALTIHEAQLKRPNSGKGKSREKEKGGTGDKIWDVPKSKEVKRLEGLRGRLERVQAGEKIGREGQDVDVGDCFCQARVHTLSAYTPHCPHCGLIVCSIQPIYLACPSCFHPLYSPASLSRLLLRLSNEIDQQYALEQSERDTQERQRRERLLAESGGGAFPSLAGTPHTNSNSSNARASKQDSRKVLTIGKGTIKTTTYRPTPTASPSASGAPSRTTTPPPFDIVPRPRSPPYDTGKVQREWKKVEAWRQDEDRPWGDIKAFNRDNGKDGPWTYVEIPLTQWVEEGVEGRRRNAKKKNRDADGNVVGVSGRVVPGAAA